MSTEEIARYEASYVHSDASPPSSPLPIPTIPTPKKRRVLSKKGKARKLTTVIHKSDVESLIPTKKLKVGEVQDKRHITDEIEGWEGGEKKIFYQTAVADSDMQISFCKSKITLCQCEIGPSGNVSVIGSRCIVFNGQQIRNLLSIKHILDKWCKKVDDIWQEGTSIQQGESRIALGSSLYLIVRHREATCHIRICYLMNQSGKLGFTKRGVVCPLSALAHVLHIMQKNVGFMNLTQDDGTVGEGEVKQFNIDNGKLLEERVSVNAGHSDQVAGVKQATSNDMRGIGPQVYPVFLNKPIDPRLS